MIQPVQLTQLLYARFSSGSTLYIPPAQPTVPDRDMYQRLGLPLTF
jgi:hypothetical protein